MARFIRIPLEKLQRFAVKFPGRILEYIIGKLAERCFNPREKHLELSFQVARGGAMQPLYIEVCLDIRRFKPVCSKVEIDFKPVWLHDFDLQGLIEIRTPHLYPSGPVACRRIGRRSGSEVVKAFLRLRPDKARCDLTLRILQFKYYGVIRR